MLESLDEPDTVASSLHPSREKLFHQGHTIPAISDNTFNQGGQWVDIIDHLSIIDHFAKMVAVLEFVVNITLKWSIFHQNIPEGR